MHEDLNQKISQFLDDELDQHESLSLLKKIQLDPGLKEKLNRYEAVSHALKSEEFLMPASDFSARISQMIDHEPAYLLPKLKSKEMQFKRSHKILAVAASIAVAFVIVGRDLNMPSTEIQASSAMQMPLSSSLSPIALASQDEQYPVNKQINDYLQAHNSSVYTNGQANFQPYTRVTAYSQK